MDESEHRQEGHEPQDPTGAQDRPEATPAAVNLSTLLDAQGHRVDGEPNPPSDPTADLPAGQLAMQLPLIPLAEVLGTALSHERLRREAREAREVSRYLIGREIAAREPALSVEHVLTLFEEGEAEVPEALRGDAVGNARWRLERALVLARQEPPKADGAPSASVQGGVFWQLLAVSYPDLFAVLYGRPARATFDVIGGAVRDPHEREASRRVLTAALRDFETHAAAVYRGDEATWRAGILTALDALAAHAFIIGVWLGQLGFARLARPATTDRGEGRESEEPPAR